MRQYLELVNRILTSESECREPLFITSLAVVSEVMGVPMAAVESIARQNNIEIITKDRGAWIDEDALRGVYADAYVRKIKCYFNNCTRHLYELNNAEQLQFYQFCNQYKKATLPGPVRKWEDIDEQSLRAHFEQEVKEKSPKQKSCPEIILDIDLANLIEKQKELVRIDLSERADSLFVESPCRRIINAYSNHLLHSVVHSRWACRKPRKNIQSQVCEHSPVWIKPARYYVYIGDDEDHIEESVLTVNDHIGGHSSNSVLRMVA